MARSLPRQRRLGRAYLNIYNDDLLSPILSETEPDEEEDEVDSITAPLQQNSSNSCHHIDDKAITEPELIASLKGLIDEDAEVDQNLENNIVDSGEGSYKEIEPPQDLQIESDDKGATEFAICSKLELQPEITVNFTPGESFLDSVDDNTEECATDLNDNPIDIDDCIDDSIDIDTAGEDYLIHSDRKEELADHSVEDKQEAYVDVIFDDNKDIISDQDSRSLDTEQNIIEDKSETSSHYTRDNLEQIDSPAKCLIEEEEVIYEVTEIQDQFVEECTVDEFQIEIVGSPNNKQSLQEVLESVDDAFSLDEEPFNNSENQDQALESGPSQIGLEDGEQTVKELGNCAPTEVKSSGIKKSTRLPQPRKLKGKTDKATVIKSDRKIQQQGKVSKSLESKSSKDKKHQPVAAPLELIISKQTIRDKNNRLVDDIKINNRKGDKAHSADNYPEPAPVSVTSSAENQPLLTDSGKIRQESKNLVTLSNVEENTDTMSGSGDVGVESNAVPFDPGAADIFEPSAERGENTDSVNVLTAVQSIDEHSKDKAEDEDYCDSLDGEGETTEDEAKGESITDVLPPDSLFEEEFKAEATALSLSISKLSETAQHDDCEDKADTSPDSLEDTELDSLDDAVTLGKQQKNKAGLIKKPESTLNQAKPQKKKDPKAVQGYTFKARPSPFSKKAADAKKSDPPENKPPAPKLDKPKGKPPIAPPPSKIKRIPTFTKPTKMDDKPAPNQNGTTKSTSPSDSEANSTTDDVFSPEADLDAVLSSKVGDGLAANILGLGTKDLDNPDGTSNNDKDSEGNEQESRDGVDGAAIMCGMEPPSCLTRRSSASGESIGSGGNESTMTNMSTLPKRVIETKTTVRRRQAIMAKKNTPMEEENDDYLTPSQRKDKMLKDLKKELKAIQVSLACKEVEMHDLLLNKEGESWERLKSKDEENSTLRKDLVVVKDKLNDMETKLTEMSEKLEERDKTIKELQDEMERREMANQEMYLKMYEKGQQSAMFERQDQLENLAEESLENVSPSELLHKLQVTQKELIRWQALKRAESYDEATKPESPADAKLHFLKDSMYHYLMDREDEGMHLRAMVGMLGFTDVQIRRIKAASEKNKGRKGSTK